MTRFPLVLIAGGLALAGALVTAWQWGRTDPTPRVQLSEVRLFNCEFDADVPNRVKIPGGMVSTIQIREDPKGRPRHLTLRLDDGSARPLTITYRASIQRTSPPVASDIHEQLLYDQASRRPERELVVGPGGGKLIIEHRMERGPVLLVLE